MRTPKRIRIVSSIKKELLKKSREAALAAVQIFNNPNITFKSETYVVLMVIAWTYLLHAFYRNKKIDYRHFKQGHKKKQFDRTKSGAYKHWELEMCLDDKQCPLDSTMVKNLKFLIGLRHEIEHQMTTRIDDHLSARFQACCINYHETVKLLFGEKYGIAKHLAISLQFSSLGREQADALHQHKGLPPNIKSYILGFDGALTAAEFGSPKYAYRVIFVPKTANHPNQADQVITFVKPDSEIAKTVNAQYTVIKEMERPKFLPSEIVSKMKSEGFARFGIHHHTDLWKTKKAKDAEIKFGIQIAKTWYWYENWVEEVRKHCQTGKFR